MIGSLMLDIEGTSLNLSDIEILNQPQVGGVILFSRNIENPGQVRALTDSIRALRGDLLIAVDQEGGRVRRLREGFSEIPAMAKLGENYLSDESAALKVTQACGYLMAAEVLSVGIDFSFAPVLDLGGISEVIRDRAFGSDAAAVTKLSAAFMRGMRQAGMSTCAKHFPGHGGCAPDSHHDQAIDERPLEQIRSSDMLPFMQNLELIDSLMPAHVIFTALDDKPAGFSTKWVQGVLRADMGFDGALFSDDLSMKAACVAGGPGERALAALGAGCDMVLVCNDRESAATALEALNHQPMPNQARLSRMRASFKPWNKTLSDTARQYPDYESAREALNTSGMIARFAE